ncbi:MAG TPA: amino acid ABC transporter permease [Pseudorhodoplanes sp.]|jgi:polar amino acid transport system permease protein|nr:amino acid ABC transporter permease [Pseudorhodoplanes sp.]
MLRFDTILGDIPYLLLGIPLTLALTFVAFAAGLLAGLPIAILRQARIPVLSVCARLVVDFFRTTPPLMHIVWAYYALPVLANIRLDAFTVVAGALACSSGAQMSEIFRGAITAVPRGQWDAAQVIGLSYAQRLWWVILPQSLRIVYAPTCNALVSLLKQSSLAAVIALPEVMNRGWVLAAQNFRPIEVLTTIAIIYFVLTWPLVLLAAHLERRSSVAFQSE